MLFLTEDTVRVSFYDVIRNMDCEELLQFFNRIYRNKKDSTDQNKTQNFQQNLSNITVKYENAMIFQNIICKLEKHVSSHL